MTYYTGKKIMKRFAIITAAAMTVLGCGEVTAIAPDGGGGKAGELVVSTGGEGGQRLEATGGSGSNDGTGGAVSTGGSAGAPATGGVGGIAGIDAGGALGTDAGATGGTVVTIDAGTGDALSCPIVPLTSDVPFQFGQLTSTGGSTGCPSANESATGGGVDGKSPVTVLNAAISANQGDQANLPTSNSCGVRFYAGKDCTGQVAQGDHDVNLQGYAPSFQLYATGSACASNGSPGLYLIVGVVSSAGISWPFGGATPGTSSGTYVTASDYCNGYGAVVTGQPFPPGTVGHEVILKLANISTTQAFTGLIDVSDVGLTFKP